MTAGTETATAVAAAKYVGYAGAVAYFETMGEIDAAILAIGILMAADIFTGWAKARRLKVSITSDKTIYGVTKKLLLILLIAMIGVAFIGLGQDPEPILRFMLPVLIVAELYSITQNIHAFFTGIEHNEQDVIEKIISLLADAMYKALDGMARKASLIMKDGIDKDSKK